MKEVTAALLAHSRDWVTKSHLYRIKENGKAFYSNAHLDCGSPVNCSVKLIGFKMENGVRVRHETWVSEDTVMILVEPPTAADRQVAIKEAIAVLVEASHSGVAFDLSGINFKSVRVDMKGDSEVTVIKVELAGWTR